VLVVEPKLTCSHLGIAVAVAVASSTLNSLFTTSLRVSLSSSDVVVVAAPLLS